MPGTSAARGDIYNAWPNAVLEGDAHLGPRRMVCVAELPNDGYVWRAMSRTTSNPQPVDLFSSADASLHLTEDGWWSYRYLRSVKKKWTGHASLCPFLATLPEPLRTIVLSHYMDRPKPVA